MILKNALSKYFRYYMYVQLSCKLWGPFPQYSAALIRVASSGAAMCFWHLIFARIYQSFDG